MDVRVWCVTCQQLCPFRIQCFSHEQNYPWNLLIDGHNSFIYQEIRKLEFDSRWGVLNSHCHFCLLSSRYIVMLALHKFIFHLFIKIQSYKLAKEEEIFSIYLSIYVFFKFSSRNFRPVSSPWALIYWSHNIFSLSFLI